MKNPRPPPTPQKPTKYIKNPGDRIEVYCRIRPLCDQEEEKCVRAKDERTVVLVPPEVSQNSNGRVMKEHHYTFTHVFDETTSQKALFQHVGKPLVKAALQGSNGLLFTYGISSSGKTYTMEGTPQDGGLLPRSLDVIFNSIKDVKAGKYVFKPDKSNGFVVQSRADALANQQKELGMFNRNKPKNRKEALPARVPDDFSFSMKEHYPDECFSVFVSYVEIYNAYIYDLLDESPKPSSKGLREDAMKNMYVSGAQEIEVTTVEEALCVFYKGQDNRRKTSTALNKDSSRSHSVFTIRIVRASRDYIDGEIFEDKELVKPIYVSQLSLVDLAGSERCKRTKNTGQKLTEAANINSSLSTLRRCIESLRKSQTSMGPYRESKLTHLFKTFFEGRGRLKMIVCINPHSDNYEETISVMQFAEITQEVEIARPTPISTPVTPRFRNGRGALYREAGVSEPVVYSLGPEFPQLITDSSDDELVLENLIEFLVARTAKRKSLNRDLERHQAKFRANLMVTYNENHQLKQEKERLQTDLEYRQQQIQNLEQKLCSVDEAMEVMQRHVDDYKRKAENASKKVYEKERLLSEQKQELERMKIRMQEEKTLTKRRMERIMDERLAEVKRKMCLPAGRVRQLRDIINAGEWDEYLAGTDIPRANIRFAGLPSTTDSESSGPVTRRKRRSAEMEEHVPETQVKSVAGVHNSNDLSVPTSSQSSKNATNVHVNKENRLPVSTPSSKGIVVANPRHRRSASTGDAWIEHNPIGNLPLTTVLQPAMKKKKSVSQLKVKDVTNSERYVLQHQEQDSQGEVETQLFKGDIIPSAGGGAQVIFNDIEKLRQASPPPVYNLRKRSGNSLPLRETEEREEVVTEKRQRKIVYV